MAIVGYLTASVNFIHIPVIICCTLITYLWGTPTFDIYLISIVRLLLPVA